MTRTEINTWKNSEIARIERETASKMAKDRTVHQDRMELIKAMGEAAQRGDFDLMAEIKGKLAMCH